MLQFPQIFLPLAAAQLLFLALYFLTRHRNFLLARLIAVWAICMICYLLVATPGTPILDYPLIAMLFRRLGTLTTILLWFIAYFMFADKHDIKPIVWICAVYYFVARTVAGLMGYLDYPFYPQTYVFTHLLGEVIRFGFIAHAIFLISKGYAGDLSVHRRPLRIGFVLGMSLILVVTVVNNSYLMFSNFLETVLSPEVSEIPFISQEDAPIPIILISIYLYFATTVLMLWQFKIPGEQASAMLGAAPVFEEPFAATSALKSDQARLIDKIKYAMEVDRLYRKHKLTVNELAEHIGSREYKVRVAINNHMKFRNFSELLNSYRISEAAKRLLDNDENVSSIGLDVGYVSLSSFHKAFKEKHRVTPKEFRRQFQVGVLASREQTSAREPMHEL